MEFRKFGLFFVLLLFYRLVPAYSNPLHEEKAKPIESTSQVAVKESVGGGHAGGHNGSMAMHGSEVHNSRNSPHIKGSAAAIPLYTTEAISHRGTYYHYHTTDNNGIHIYVPFYQYLLLVISIAFMF